MKRLITVLAAISLPFGACFAQEHFISVGGDILERGELRIGGVSEETEKPDGDMAAFIVNRARVNVDYKWKNTIETCFTAQYSGTWGMADGSLSIYEAWGQVNFGKGFFTKLGRQALSYDDERMFGSDDWSMTGSVHDALKLGYEGHGHKIHLIGAYNQNPDNIEGGTFFTGGIQPYKFMQSLWYHYDVPTFPLGVSLLFMNVGMQGEPQEDVQPVWWQQVAGAYLEFNPGRWKVKADAYMQFGTHETGIPLRAWMASGKVSYAALPSLSVYLGYDYMSGDTDYAVPAGGQIGLQRHDVIRGFSSVYGSHHKFYGAMDFFYVSDYYHGFTPGLQNLYAGVNWEPIKNWGIDLSYHFLATGAKLRNADMPLGHEVEFSTGYSFNKYLSLSAGYSFMYGTETMVVLKRSSDNRMLNWAWLMLRITPSFSR